MSNEGNKMKLGQFDNPFGAFDDQCKKAIKAIVSIAASRENEKVVISTNELAEKSMWVITYDGLLWQLIQVHDLITDALTYEVMFIEMVGVNPNASVEIAEDGHMTLCEFQIEEEE